MVLRTASEDQDIYDNASDMVQELLNIASKRRSMTNQLCKKMMDFSQIDSSATLAALSGFTFSTFAATGLTVEEVLLFETFSKGFKIVKSNDVNSTNGDDEWTTETLCLKNVELKSKVLVTILLKKLSKAWNPEFQNRGIPNGIISKSFWMGVIHDVYVDKKYRPLTLKTINNRVAHIADLLEARHSLVDTRNKKRIGMMWQMKLPQIPPLEAEAAWLNYQQKRIIKSPIDVNAKIRVPRHYQDWNMDDLKKNGLDFIKELEKPLLTMLELGEGRGSILHGQCFSIPFLAWTYMEGIKECDFMEDPMYPNTKRLLRVSSVNAGPNSEIFAAFGGTEPKLVKAAPCTTWERAILQCMKSEEEARTEYIRKYYSNRRDREYVETHTPQSKVYDLLVLAVGEGGFGWHSDERQMLFSDDPKLPQSSSFRKHHLRVPTAYFQNSASGHCRLQFRDKTDQKQTKTIELGTAGVHWQGDFNQANLHHRAIQQSSHGRFYRLTVSCRESPPKLQKEGRLNISQEYPNARVFPSEYNIKIDLLQSHHQATAEASCIRGSNEVAARFPGLVTYKAECKNKAQPTKLPPLTSDKTGEQPKQWQALLDKIADQRNYERRADFEALPPEYPLLEKPTMAMDSAPISKRISSGPILENLEASGYRVGIRKENDDIRWQGTRLGNEMEIRNLKPGDCVRRQQVQTSFGLRVNNHTIEPFSPNGADFNCFHLSKPCRSSLLPWGPLLEFLLLCADGDHSVERKGFRVSPRGGGMKASGSAGPTVDAPVVVIPGYTGCSHSLPSPQDISKNHNAALLEACLNDKIVHVFVTDQLLPKSLRENAAKEPMSGYCGCYKLKSAQTSPGMKHADIKAFIEEVKKVYGERISPQELTAANLSFLSQKCFSVELEPVAAATMPHTKDLVISVGDKRRICVPIPVGESAEEICIDFENEFGNIPDDPDPAADKPDDTDDDPSPSPEADVTPNSQFLVLQPLKRSLGQDDIARILSSMLLGAAFRFKKFSIDERDRAGPLVDVYEGSQFKIPTLKDYFGISPNRSYVSMIGTTSQMQPGPCPDRDCDSKQALLLEEYPPLERPARNAKWVTENPEACERLVQVCMFAEVIGNANTLHLWRRSYHKSSQVSEAQSTSSQLIFPSGGAELASFISLITESQVTEKSSVQHFLHGQYCQAKFINSEEDLIRVLTAIGTISQSLLQQMQKDGEVDFLSSFEFLKAQFGLHSLTPSHHQLASMLCNMDMLLADQPFGRPLAAYRGAGSKNGARLVDFDAVRVWLHQFPKYQLTGKESEEEIILVWLEVRVREFSEFRDWFRPDCSGSGLVIAYSGRDVNVLDAEHFLCKLYIYMEWEDGGGRAFSKKKAYRKDYCHPIRNANFACLDAYMESIVRELGKRLDDYGLYVKRRDEELCSKDGKLFVALQQLSTLALQQSKNQVGYITSFTEYRARDVHSSRMLTTLAGGTIHARIDQCANLDDASRVLKRFELPAATVYTSTRLECQYKKLFKWTKDGRSISKVLRVVPLEGHLFLFIESGVSEVGYHRSDDDVRVFLYWAKTLPDEEQADVLQFYNDCLEDCHKDRTQLCVYKCSVGDVVSFKGAKTRHAILIPGSQRWRVYIAHDMTLLEKATKKRRLRDEERSLQSKAKRSSSRKKLH